MAAGLALLPLWSLPAGAHSGNRAQLYVDSVRLEPHSDGWQVALVVRDADSGQLEPGFGVQLTASGPDGKTIGPVALTDPRANGHYGATVPLPDGPSTLTFQAAEIPGGPQAIPFTKTWRVTLQAGRPLELGGSGAPASGGTQAAVPLALALVAIAGLFALTRTRRFRTRTGHPGAPAAPWHPEGPGAAASPTPDRPASDLPSRT